MPSDNGRCRASPLAVWAVGQVRSRDIRVALNTIIVRFTKVQIVSYLKSGSFNSRRLADIVNYIRLNEESFKEWHRSETAKLFAPLYSAMKRKRKDIGFSAPGAVRQSVKLRRMGRLSVISDWSYGTRH